MMRECPYFGSAPFGLINDGIGAVGQSCFGAALPRGKLDEVWQQGGEDLFKILGSLALEELIDGRLLFRLTPRTFRCIDSTRVTLFHGADAGIYRLLITTSSSKNAIGDSCTKSLGRRRPVLGWPWWIINAPRHIPASRSDRHYPQGLSDLGTLSAMHRSWFGPGSLSSCRWLWSRSLRCWSLSCLCWREAWRSRLVHASLSVLASLGISDHLILLTLVIDLGKTKLLSHSLLKLDEEIRRYVGLSCSRDMPEDILHGFASIRVAGSDLKNRILATTEVPVDELWYHVVVEYGAHVIHDRFNEHEHKIQVRLAQSVRACVPRRAKIQDLGQDGFSHLVVVMVDERDHLGGYLGTIL